MVNTTRPRPYWHVDAKWICGILLFFTLNAAALFGSLASLTEEKQAIEFSTIIVASLFSKNGLDAQEDLTTLKQQAASSPAKTVAPIPNFPFVTVTEADLNSLSPRELRLSIFRQITTPIYQKGVSGAAQQFTSDPLLQEQFKKDALLLNIFTRQTHDQFQRNFYVATALALPLLAAFVFFSFGWGRLANPGIMFFFIGLPGAIASLILTHPPEENTSGKSFGFLPQELATQIGNTTGRVYITLLFCGILLVLLAAIGKVISSRKHT